MNFRKTPIAAAELGLSYWELMGMLRSRRIAQPNRDSSGHFVWTDSDLDRVRQALAAKTRPQGVPA
jgi:hypothetical protein